MLHSEIRSIRYRVMLDKFEKRPSSQKKWPRIPLCRLKRMRLQSNLTDRDLPGHPFTQVFKLFGYIPGLAISHVSTRDMENNLLVLSPEERESWSPTWRRVNREFEDECSKDPISFGWMKDCLFGCCDWDLRLRCWLLAGKLHPDDEKYHPRVECVILEKANIPELWEVSGCRFELPTYGTMQSSSLDGIDGGWVAEALCTKAVLSQRMDDFRNVLGEETVDQYKSRVRKGRRCWYSRNMNTACAAHVLSLGSSRQSEYLIPWWESVVPKYDAIVDPALGEEFLDTVKDLWFVKYFTHRGHHTKGLSVMPDIVRTFASACVPNRLRCKLVKAHFQGDGETKKKYHHPRLNSDHEIRDWLEHWGTWAQVKSLALDLMKDILLEDTAFGSNISPTRKLDLKQQESMCLEFKSCFKTMRQELWDATWVSDEKIPSAVILIGRAKRILFRYFVHPAIESRSHDASVVPSCLTLWSNKESRFSMWVDEDLMLDVRTEWEYRNCLRYVKMDCKTKEPPIFGLEPERLVYRSQRSCRRDLDDWFQGVVQPRCLQVTEILELPKGNSVLMQVVKGYMRDRSRLKRCKLRN